MPIQSKTFMLPRKQTVNLRDYDPDDTGPFAGKEDVLEHTEELKEKLVGLQDMLVAQKKRSLLVVLQGMDCSGKDGVIKHVFAGINPQGFRVTSFKKPTEEEAARDFLWRVHQAVPARGSIAAFNRSHYEDALVPRVHKQLQDGELKERYKRIRDFEKLLASNGTAVVKLFLHISKDYQLEKIRDRLQHPHKRWKFAKSDLLERRHWDAYQEAYEDIFTECSGKGAPWYVVPANKRWYRNYVVLRILVETLEKMELAYPEPDLELERLLEDIRG